jgi:diamine N-acetyltransferase
MPFKAIRPATDADIEWLVGQEHRSDFAAFIHRWTPDEHLRNLADTDKRYLIAEDETYEQVGFVILAGFASKDRNIELVRMAVTRPGGGIGRPLLLSLLELAFNDLGAHRLWLDVFDDNVRAQNIYETVGFHEDGTPRQTAFKTNGQRGSLVVMSLLATEYQARVGRR